LRSNASEIATGILKAITYQIRHSGKTRGRVVEIENNTLPDQRVFAARDVPWGGFTTEDVLWAAGIWSVILTMSPVIVFYMLMVA
jgi:hypothetical protein